MTGTTIRLKTCFALSGADSETRILPEEVGTVADLLLHIGREADFRFMNPAGQLEEDLEILVNRKEIWFYPKALNTELQDGDVVEIYLLPLGGG